MLFDKIKAMDDFQVLRFYNHFSREVLSGISGGLSDVQANIPADAQSLAQMSAIPTMPMNETVPDEKAAYMARRMLQEWAKDEELSPILQAVLDDYKDNEMAAGVILSLGMAVSMALVAATSSMEIKIGSFEFSLGKKASPKAVERIESFVPQRQSTPQRIRHLKMLVGQNKVGRALDQMTALELEDKQLENAIITLAYRYHALKQDNHSNLLGREDYNVESTKLSYDVLALIDRIEVDV